MPISRYKIDPDGLAAACDHLGIKRPVRVTIRSTSVLGRYVGTGLSINGLFHRLVLNAYLHPDDAESTVWHELVHVKQSERLGGSLAFNREWDRQFAAAGLRPSMINRMTIGQLEAYFAMPLEREAEKEATRPHLVQVTVPR